MCPQAADARLMSTVSRDAEEAEVWPQKLMLIVALQRHRSGGSAEFSRDAWDPRMTPGVAEKLASVDVEQALWEAANRPLRPNAWASIPSPPWPAPHAEPHAETSGKYGFAAPMGYPGPLQPGPQELTNMSEIPHPPQAGLQKLSGTSEDRYFLQPGEAQPPSLLSMPPGLWSTPTSPPFDTASLYVLPDVPPGLQSVDQLCTHIPIA